ncbi:MAG TPA: bifunctional adenosylcobinamide kinase/adenosylcobinamide-phosphate guanylyltransferase [Flexivirga sp.]|uniref:bifunctional adenosylcobinamide kinase/adenosylcobinamide-phosphate guanylyltransferase n=1 Tax=Flexivirga sp. TaxID=1962927 RepID=UPI002C328C02|nr:bifunctional adenosylcobinamide kinase/adenosylcobinamide-phosphate guanylyltransferase [Flexivirga sp.]HWC21718.1 bifunctional adenosylcobinamide kinase/adenosylcobinamide-phosphate guanylyltransferase [Flexivirga sp.]
MRVLVTGGVRSGKSAHAETLLANRAAVTYVAPGPTPTEDSDPDWVSRIEAHRARRPESWITLETPDLSSALARTDGPVLVDCLGTWLTAVLDERSLWESSGEEATAIIGQLAQEAADLLDVRGESGTVLVTNEVGLGVVPAHRSGRLFRDLLGLVNQRIAAACDEVHLVVAGRVLVL